LIVKRSKKQSKMTVGAINRLRVQRVDDVIIFLLTAGGGLVLAVYCAVCWGGSWIK
jgi:hypothetical protein